MADSVNYRHKDTVFRLLFSNKERLLSLYNALNKTSYNNPDELKVVTLDNAIYMEVKNDIAFLIADSLHLYEHQSTRNPNMPLRFLQYIASEYQRIVETNKQNLYSRKIIKLPAPQFVVFYNGTEKTADHEVLRLSTAFEKPKSTGDDKRHDDAQGAPDEERSEKPKLELVVDVYNINVGFNKEILETCETLGGYSEFVRRIRENQKTMLLDQAVKKAVDECIHDGILADFLRVNKSEVVGMSIFEFNREEYDNMVRTEGKAEGRVEGMFKTLYGLVKKKLLSLSSAAKEVGQSEEEFAAGMEAYFEQSSVAK